jgi:RNA polymerase sigma factor (sigma-70 family)
MEGASTAVEAVRRHRRLSGDLEATRQSLLTRLKDHADHEGWQRFFDQYGGVIHGVALKAGLTATEAEEALQETLVSVSREMPGFRYDPARGSFKAWLFQIARRRVADQFRKRARILRREAPTAEDLMELADPGSESLGRAWDDEWRRNQVQLALDRVKAKVSPRQWQMFDLGTLQEWPTDRICALLGVNAAQLYMARMRVGRMLKAEVGNLREDFEG